MKKVSVFLIISMLFLNSCAVKAFQLPQDFEYGSLIIGGKGDGVLNGEYAEDFVEKVILPATPVKEQKINADYFFQINEIPKENRRELNYVLSAEDRILKGEDRCYRLTEEGLAMALLLADPNKFISDQATMVEASYTEELVEVTAQYRNCFLARSVQNPAITIKVFIGVGSFDHTVGDRIILTSAGNYYKDGNRLQMELGNARGEKDPPPANIKY